VPDRSSDSLKRDTDFLLESSSGSEGENLLIPSVFSLVIFVTGYAFGSSKIASISIHVLDLVAGAGGFLAFWFFRFLRRRFFTQSLQTNVFIWLASGAVAAGAPNLAMFALTGGFPESLLVQLPLGLISYPTLMAISALAIANWRASRVRLADLSLQRQELAERQLRLNDEVNLIRGKMKNEIRIQLKSALESTENQLRIADPASYLQASAQLRAVIDNVLRPLSWTISSKAFEASSDDGLSKEAMSKYVSRDLKRRPHSVRGIRVSLSRLTAPRLFGLAALIFVIPASVFVEGLLGGIAAALSALLNVVILTAIRRSKRSPRLHPWVGAALITVLVTAASLISPAIFLGVNQPLVFAGGVVAGFFMVGLFSSILMAFATMRVENIQESIAINKKLNNLLDQLRQQIWVAKTELAKTVHGTVQSKLLVASLKLENHQQESGIARAALSDIQEAISSIDGGDQPEVSNIVDSLSNLKSSWAGACNISVFADHETCELIDQDPIARACVMEVLREIAANAAKHSGAPFLNIHIEALPGQNVELQTRSRGKIDSERTPGFGTQVVSAATTKWDMRQVEEFVEISATVALNPARV
jgi:hypothetical protein